MVDLLEDQVLCPQLERAINISRHMTILFWQLLQQVLSGATRLHLESISTPSPHDVISTPFSST